MQKNANSPAERTAVAECAILPILRHVHHAVLIAAEFRKAAPASQQRDHFGSFRQQFPDQLPPQIDGASPDLRVRCEKTISGTSTFGESRFPLGSGEIQRISIGIPVCTWPVYVCRPSSRV